MASFGVGGVIWMRTYPISAGSEGVTIGAGSHCPCHLRGRFRVPHVLAARGPVIAVPVAKHRQREAYGVVGVWNGLRGAGFLNTRVLKMFQSILLLYTHSFCSTAMISTRWDSASAEIAVADALRRTAHSVLNTTASATIEVRRRSIFTPLSLISGPATRSVCAGAVERPGAASAHRRPD